MKKLTRAIYIFALLAASAGAQLAGQLGVLDPLNANGGINPQTGVAWVEGDQYRLAFYTEDKTNALSGAIADYNTFVQSVATGSTNFSKLGEGTWKVLGSTDTVSARQNTGTDTNDGLPIFVLDGRTMIARDSADMWDGFSVRFEAVDSPNGEIMFYSPYLNEDGEELVEFLFGTVIATGTTIGGGIAGDPLGDPDNTLRLTVGASQANAAGRIWARFGNRDPRADYSFYALSEPLAITTDDLAPPIRLTITPNTSTPGSYDFAWDSQVDKLYDLVSEVSPVPARTAWPVWDNRADMTSDGATTSLLGVPGGDDRTRYFSIVEKNPPLP